MTAHEALRDDFERRIRDRCGASSFDFPRSLANELVHLCVLHGLLPETAVRGATGDGDAPTDPPTPEDK